MNCNQIHKQFRPNFKQDLPVPLIEEEESNEATAIVTTS
jgi:hypothetical protein